MNYKKLIAFILSIIGISVVSCSKYGAPYLEFKLKGKITDTLDNPIGNIRVNIQEGGYSARKTYTDMEGNYFIDTDMEDYSIAKNFPFENTTIMIKVEDTDGEENGGEFATQIITFPLKKSDNIKEKEKKKDKWYKGTVSKEINFKLTNK